jgi:hypothetical protein
MRPQLQLPIDKAPLLQAVAGQPVTRIRTGYSGGVPDSHLHLHDARRRHSSLRTRQSQDGGVDTPWNRLSRQSRRKLVNRGLALIGDGQLGEAQRVLEMVIRNDADYARGYI